MKAIPTYVNGLVIEYLIFMENHVIKMMSRQVAALFTECFKVFITEVSPLQLLRSVENEAFSELCM